MHDVTSAVKQSLGHRLNHLPAIDGLRAIAVIAVVAFHFDLKLPGGFLGVDLFFAVSGFVIARGLLTTTAGTVTTRDALRAFYRRRVWRLWPALFALLLATVFIATIVRPRHWESPGITIKNAVAALFAGSNWFQVATPDSAAPLFRPLLHMWSLSIEEQFYLVFPVLMLVFRQHAKRVATVVGSTCLGMAAVTALLSPGPRWSFMATPARIGAVGAGVLVATLLDSRNLHGGDLKSNARFGWIAMMLFIVSAAVMAVAAWDSRIIWRGGYVVCSIVFGAIVWLTAQAEGSLWCKLLSYPVMQWFGTRSYSLYLVNFPIAGYISADGVTTLPERIAGVAASLVLAELGFRLIESPLRQRGRRVAHAN